MVGHMSDLISKLKGKFTAVHRRNARYALGAKIGGHNRVPAGRPGDRIFFLGRVWKIRLILSFATS